MQRILVIIGISVIFSCNTSKPSIVSPTPIPSKDMNKDLSGNWELQKLWAPDNKWAIKPFMVIDYDNKIFKGNNGCNSISGKFTLSASFIAFDKQMISTKMACLGYSEGAFNNALLRVNKFSVTNNELEFSQDDIVLLSFKKQ